MGIWMTLQCLAVISLFNSRKSLLYYWNTTIAMNLIFIWLSKNCQGTLGCITQENCSSPLSSLEPRYLFVSTQHCVYVHINVYLYSISCSNLPEFSPHMNLFSYLLVLFFFNLSLIRVVILSLELTMRTWCVHLWLQSWIPCILFSQNLLVVNRSVVCGWVPWIYPSSIVYC